MPENQTNSNNSELSPKQEMLITALLSLPTIEAASLATGITSKTARIWMKQPVFQDAYKAAKGAVFDDALDELRDCAKEAIDTLKSNLKALEPAVQVRAAHIILTQSIQVHKIEALEARIQELEEALKAGRA